MVDKNSHEYRFGGNREKTIIRDGGKCVKCGMNREDHQKRFSRDITVDHINGRGRNTPTREQDNRLENLQTLCLECHGKKDTVRAKNRVIGIRHWKSKLSDNQVKSMRIDYSSGEKTQQELANEYGVCQQTVSFAIRGVYWKHII